jgi:hypothetical protein
VRQGDDASRVVTGRVSVPDWYDLAVVVCLTEILRRYGPERAAIALRAYQAARP